LKILRTRNLIGQLTPWIRNRSGKLVVALMFKKFHDLYGIHLPINLFARASQDIFCGLFYDALSFSDYIALDGKYIG
jgi:hypothetical protein